MNETEWDRDRDLRDYAYDEAKRIAQSYLKILEEAIFCAILKGARYERKNIEETELMGEE